MIISKEEFKWRTKELFNISAPLVLEQVFITLMGLINTVMVSSVGEHAVSATGMIDSVSNLIIALFAALTTGSTIVIAQYTGQKEKEKAKIAGGQSIILSLILSLTITILIFIFKSLILEKILNGAEYKVYNASLIFLSVVCFSFPMLALFQTVFAILRGSGDTRTPMFITFFMNVVNIILGYILITGIEIFGFQTPGFGILGAAIALFSSRSIGACISLYFIFRKSRFLRLNSLKYFIPHFRTQKTILNLGVPTSVESTLFQFGKLITQIFIVHMGTAAMAANTIANGIFGLINVPGTALTIGVMILVGQRVGRGEISDVKKTTIFAAFFSTCMLSAFCFICFIFSDQIISIYNPSDETAAYLTTILHSTFLATSLLWSCAFVTPAALRACGDVKFTMYAAIFTMCAFRLAVGYLLGIVFGLGVIAIWYGMFIDWIMRAILFTLRLARGKWMDKSIV